MNLLEKRKTNEKWNGKSNLARVNVWYPPWKGPVNVFPCMDMPEWREKARQKDCPANQLSHKISSVKQLETLAVGTNVRTIITPTTTSAWRSSLKGWRTAIVSKTTIRTVANMTFGSRNGAHNNMARSHKLSLNSEPAYCATGKSSHWRSIFCCCCCEIEVYRHIKLWCACSDMLWKVK